MENDNYKPTQAELDAFIADRNGYAKPQPQVKKKATGYATLKCLLGNGANGPIYQTVMYLKPIKLVKWEYSRMIKQNPNYKKSLEIDYQYE